MIEAILRDVQSNTTLPIQYDIEFSGEGLATADDIAAHPLGHVTALIQPNGQPIPDGRFDVLLDTGRLNWRGRFVCIEKRGTIITLVDGGSYQPSLDF